MIVMVKWLSSSSSPACHLLWDVEIHFSLDMAQQVWHMQLNPVQTLTYTCKSTGALSQRSTAAWAEVVSHTPQVRHLQGVL